MEQQIIQSKVINLLCDAVSVLKTLYVYTNDNLLYGFNEDLGFIREIILPLEPNEYLPKNIFRVADLVNLKKYGNINEDIYIFGDDSYILMKDTLGVNMIAQSCRPNTLFGLNIYDFEKRISKAINPEEKYPVTFSGDIKEFMYELLEKKKASDGAFMMKLGGYRFFIYKGLIPFNKSDGLLCSIFDCKERFYDFLIVKFTTIKKKQSFTTTIVYNKLV